MDPKKKKDCCHFVKCGKRKRSKRTFLIKNIATEFTNDIFESL